MDAIFMECVVFHNASEKIKVGWSHSPPDTEGKFVFYAASGRAFKLHTPGIKAIRHLGSRAYVFPGLQSTRGGLRLRRDEHFRGMAQLSLPEHS